ncbi:MAG TPA: MurR/RpiR family transcriptional regulator [Candidatus Mediterraneibacter vanvlietii]|nr:MurR/RpiR family transcriptional regulator [Candidatus Mediterraneibacter vanvlietii]
MEYLKSVIPVIEANYKNFTTVEKVIADFFRENDEMIDLSAKGVADRLFVSEASLSRFAKKCGFRGYREFIYQYEQDMAAKSTDLQQNTSSVLNVYQELLNKAYSLIDENQIVRICRTMQSSQRVFVCGKGSSGLSAMETASRFMRVGVDIDSVTDSDSMRFHTVFQDKKCMVIGISVGGTSEDVLYLLREAHAKHAKTVLITAQKRTWMESFCDEIVLIPSLKYLNYGNVISPQFPILILIDILYSYFVSMDKGRLQGLHSSTLKALHSLSEDGESAEKP